MSKKKKRACLAQKDVKLHLRYFYAHKNLKKPLFSCEMFLCAQKSQKAQDVKRFFFLDVLCAQKCCIFYLLMCICCFFLLFFLLDAFMHVWDCCYLLIGFYTFYACGKTVLFTCLCAFCASYAKDKWLSSS